MVLFSLTSLKKREMMTSFFLACSQKCNNRAIKAMKRGKIIQKSRLLAGLELQPVGLKVVVLAAAFATLVAFAILVASLNENRTLRINLENDSNRFLLIFCLLTEKLLLLKALIVASLSMPG